MNELTHILAQADEHLTAAELGSDHRGKLAAFSQFMRSLEQLAQLIWKGSSSWDEARSWGKLHAERFARLQEPLNAWEIEMEELLHGGEEECEWALDRRSQHAVARELFLATPADEALAAYEDSQVDEALRQKAEWCSITAPEWAPPSHTWWHRPDKPSPP